MHPEPGTLVAPVQGVTAESECSHRVSADFRYLSHPELILPSLLPLPPDLLLEPFDRDLEPLVTTLQRIHVLSLYKLEI